MAVIQVMQFILSYVVFLHFFISPIMRLSRPHLTGNAKKPKVGTIVGVVIGLIILLVAALLFSLYKVRHKVYRPEVFVDVAGLSCFSANLFVFHMKPILKL